MKIEGLKIKENITFQDKIIAVNMIVNHCFYDNEYKPYYKEMGITNAIAEIFLIGVEFDEEDDIYELSFSNEELKHAVELFSIKAQTQEEYEEELKAKDNLPLVLQEIVGYANEMIEQRKAELVAIKAQEANPVNSKMLEILNLESRKLSIEIKVQEEAQKGIETTNNIASQLTEEEHVQLIKMQLEGNVDGMNAMTDRIVDRFSENAFRKQKDKLVSEIEAKDKIIKMKDRDIDDLQIKYAKEKQRESVKNVLADNQ